MDKKSQNIINTSRRYNFSIAEDPTYAESDRVHNSPDVSREPSNERKTTEVFKSSALDKRNSVEMAARKGLTNRGRSNVKGRPLVSLNLKPTYSTNDNTTTG